MTDELHTAAMKRKRKDIYVVVAKNDVPHPRYGLDEGGEIVFETYTREASLEFARKKAKQLSKTLGECRVARLEFIDE